MGPCYPSFKEISPANANSVMRCMQLSQANMSCQQNRSSSFQHHFLNAFLSSRFNRAKTFLFFLCYSFSASLDTTLVYTPNIMFIAQVKVIVKFCRFSTHIFLKQTFLRIHTTRNFCPGFHPLSL